jgi:hypothetical protein
MAEAKRVERRGAAVARRCGKLSGWLLPHICKGPQAWPQESTPNPILVINQTHDPNAFYGNAVAAQRELGNAVLLTQEGYGHLYFQDPSTCVTEAMAAYLTQLITPPSGTVCQSDRQPFDPDFGQPVNPGFP